MEINHEHPAFAVWHCAETPIRDIPAGALLKWHEGIIVFGFHLGGGLVAARHGVIRAEALKTDPAASLKERFCVLGRDGRAVVFREETRRAEFLAGRYVKRQEFISACICEELGTFGNFPVWIHERFGKCYLHPVAPDARYGAYPEGRSAIPESPMT